MKKKNEISDWLQLLIPLAIVVVIVFAAMGGWTGVTNRIHKRGGMVGTKKGDYIMIDRSGGVVMSIKKYRNIYVDDLEDSDGIGFYAKGEGYIHMPTIHKVIRVTTEEEWNAYEEYDYYKEFSKLLREEKAQHIK